MEEKFLLTWTLNENIVENKNIERIQYTKRFRNINLENSYNKNSSDIGHISLFLGLQK